MSLIRSNLSGWGIGAKVASSELNDIDAAIEGALDKRAGYTDNLSSAVSLAGVIQGTGAGRYISAIATGPDADTAFNVNAHNAVVRIPTLTAARAYTCDNGGATMGDRMLFYVEGTGATASGYVDIKNSIGTGLVRLAAPALSDQAQAASAEVVFNGSGWQLLQTTNASMSMATFLASGSVVVPDGVRFAILVGCGGGGGGAAGYQVSSAVDRFMSGGGGGGGAHLTTHVVPVVPRSTLTMTVGAGGAGATVAGAGGANGTASTVTDGVTTWTFEAAGGALGSYYIGSGATQNAVWSQGGLQGPYGAINEYHAGHTSSPPALMVYPSCGGFGATNNTSAVQGRNGQKSPQGFAGGSYGAHGADSGSYRGGGAGGGGGAGPFGAGADGGGGGNGNNGGAGFGGGLGSTASANTGGGGGGGGAPGAGSGGTGTHGSAGDGGSGKILVYWIR